MHSTRPPKVSLRKPTSPASSLVNSRGTTTIGHRNLVKIDAVDSNKRQPDFTGGFLLVSFQINRASKKQRFEIQEFFYCELINRVELRFSAFIRQIPQPTNGNRNKHFAPSVPRGTTVVWVCGFERDKFCDQLFRLMSRFEHRRQRESKVVFELANIFRFANPVAGVAQLCHEKKTPALKALRTEKTRRCSRSRRHGGEDRDGEIE